MQGEQDKAEEEEKIGRQNISNNVEKARFNYKEKIYACSLGQSLNELRIINPQGKVLAVTKGDHIGLLGTSRDNAQSVDVTQPH